MTSTRNMGRYERFLVWLQNKIDRKLQEISDKAWEKQERRQNLHARKPW